MVNHFEFGFDAEARTMTILGREYSLSSLLRTIIFVTAYLLLRPYLLKLGGKYQEMDHGREVGTDGNADSLAATGKVAPGGEDSDSDGEDDGWGAKARRRARAERKKAQEAAREADEAEDRELAAMLED
ncbi:secretory pathway protein Pga2 [Sphaerosporella brunnea]|uniref:Secretory pathway protein Pga2 n=1 Tax=Sphaerosporella brunnea TaxID=1250544 RepID=A0A5J5ELK4_9PEZI|nr:secretory pathway protein Pga2 [Sphaerosporella brunnea]